MITLVSGAACWKNGDPCPNHPHEREGDSEEILMVLADPIDWVCRTYTDGIQWQGQSERAQYRIIPPREPDDVDFSSYQQSWRLSFCPVGEYNFSLWIPVPSCEYAKYICLRHAITGDRTEIDALHNAAEVEYDAFPFHRIVDEAERLLTARAKFRPWILSRRTRTRWSLPQRAIGAFILYASTRPAAGA